MRVSTDGQAICWDRRPRPQTRRKARSFWDLRVMQRFSRYRAHCGRDSREPSKSLECSWQVPWAVALQLDEWFVMI